MKLQDQLWRTEGAFEFGVSATLDVVHAVAQHDSHRVAALLKLKSDVVNVIQTGFAIIGPARLQNRIADLPAVEIKLVKPKAAYVHFRAAYRLGKVKSAPQQRKRHRRNDPLGLPLVGGQQSHGPVGRRAPGRWMIVLIPYTNLPIALLARFQRFAGVCHEDRLVRGDFPAIPEVALVVCKPIGRGGDQHSIGALLLASLGGFENPTQTRMKGLDAPWIRSVLALKMSDGQIPRKPLFRGGCKHR